MGHPEATSELAQVMKLVDILTLGKCTIGTHRGAATRHGLWPSIVKLAAGADWIEEYNPPRLWGWRTDRGIAAPWLGV